MTPEQTDIILKTIPFLESRGGELTCHFYRRLFKNHPELRAFFNPAHQQDGSQQKALAGAICAYAQHIENPSALAGAVELIAHKHASLGVKPEHYPVVGEHLLASIKELLGDDCTPDILDAWGEAYGVLADIFVKREAKIYEEQSWTGFKPFTLEKKVDEGGPIVSFYLRPQDGQIQRHLPGQYLTVRVPHPETGTSMRNYSISMAAGGPMYRISVKKEEGATEDAPGGYVSHYLHDTLKVGDTLEVGPPCGEFILDTSVPWERPVALIAGGVGITPLLAMAQSVSQDQPGRPVYLLQGARGSDAHAFQAELRDLATKSPSLSLHVRYDQGTDEERESGACDDFGVIDAELLKAFIPLDEAEIYVCGPAGMMSAVQRALRDLGVPAERHHHEFFGPAKAL